MENLPRYFEIRPGDKRESIINSEVGKDKIRKDLVELGHPRDVHAYGRFEQFKNDGEFILEVMQTYGPFVEIASPDLLSNKDFIIKAVSIWGHAFYNAASDLQKDIDVQNAVKKWQESYNRGVKDERSKAFIDLNYPFIIEKGGPIKEALFEFPKNELVQGTTDSAVILSFLEKKGIDTSDLTVEVKFYLDTGGYKVPPYDYRLDVLISHKHDKYVICDLSFFRTREVKN